MIFWCRPLREDEVLPVRTHRVVSEGHEALPEPTDDKHKKHHRKERERARKEKKKEKKVWTDRLGDSISKGATEYKHFTHSGFLYVSLQKEKKEKKKSSKVDDGPNLLGEDPEEEQKPVKEKPVENNVDHGHTDKAESVGVWLGAWDCKCMQRIFPSPVPCVQLTITPSASRIFFIVIIYLYGLARA